MATKIVVTKTGAVQMAARGDLSKAKALSDQLDAINQALAGLAAGYTIAGIFCRDGGIGQISCEVPLPTNAVQTALQNRATAIQNQLAALGIT